MQSTSHANNPFALLLNPAAVLAEIEHSERLNRLASRICRPLDKPGLQGADGKGESAPVIIDTAEPGLED